MGRYQFDKTKLVDKMVGQMVDRLKNKLYRQHRWACLKEDRRQVVAEAKATYDMVMPKRLCE